MIEPALTKEEWAAKNALYGFIDSQGDLRLPMEEAIPQGRDRHAVAALALYGQPFGFTREELKLMDFLALDTHAGDIEWGDDMPELAKSIAAKIRALLPPEKK